MEEGTERTKELREPRSTDRHRSQTQRRWPARAYICGMIFERVSRSTYPPQNGKLRKYIKLILTTFIHNLDVFYQLVVSFIHSGLIFEAWIFAQASRRLVQIGSGLFAHPTKLLQISSTISCLSFHHVAHNLIPPYLTIFLPNSTLYI